MKNNTPMNKILPFQLPIRPALPTVYGNVDYTQLSNQLHRIDQLLRVSGVEQEFVEMSMDVFFQRAGDKPIKTEKHLRHQKHSYRALRCMVLMSLLGESFRGMSSRLAECALFRWFCGMEEMGSIRVPSKSMIQQYANWLPAESMRVVVERLIEASRSEASSLNLANAIELETIWMDTTCVEANIHFPVDWVLLRDGVRTLMKATGLIRRNGLKERMADPKVFLKRINALCMQMSGSRRRVDGHKQRKKTLRLMKKLVKVVESHARRHRDLLEEQWERTDWSLKQAQGVIRRIDSVLELLPLAARQAHERIIGGRSVANQDKILSLYERQIHVLVRGKAGAEVEFGNKLLLAEQNDGLIVDWQLCGENSPADSQLLAASLQRMEKAYGSDSVKAVGTDRGFESSDNKELLQGAGIYNGMCPKQPQELKKRMQQPRFARIQKRRSQTEARVGIFKNSFLGRPLRTKGLLHRQLSVDWNVLAHNLWVLARLPQAEEKLQMAA